MFAGGTSTGDRAGDPIAVLGADLEAVAGCELAGVGDAELVGSSIALEKLALRLDAERIRRLGEVDARGAWALDGSRSPAVWLARKAGMGHGEAARRCKAARGLRSMPQVEAAFGAGRLSLGQVRALCLLVDDRSTEAVRAAFAAAEGLLVDVCEGLGERETREVVRFWWARVDPDGYRDRWDDLYEKRGLHASETFEGALAIDGTLDPDQGQLVLRALTAIEEDLWRQDQAAVARGELAPRTAAQRRADALALMAEIALDHLGDHHPADPADPAGGTSEPTTDDDTEPADGADSADAADGDRATDNADPAGGEAEPANGQTTDDDTEPADGADSADAADGGDRGRGAARTGDEAAEAAEVLDLGLGPEPADGPTEATPTPIGDRGDRPASGRVRRPRTWGTVTVDLVTLAGLTGDPDHEHDLDLGGPLGTPLVERDPALWGGATLGPNQIPLPLEAVRRLCCDAGLSVVVTDGRGVPLDVGRASRTVTPAIRRALDVRDRGCAFGGCTMPAQWCDAHHIAWWHRDGGTTSLDNLVLLCRHHHRLLHEGGWRCSLDPTTRRPKFEPPPPAERAPPHHHAA